LTQRGFLKRVPLDEIPVQGRGGMGVGGLDPKMIKTAGPVVAAAAGMVSPATSVDVLTADGKRQRVPVTEIPVQRRTNRGTRLVTLEEANQIVVMD